MPVISMSVVEPAAGIHRDSRVAEFAVDEQLAAFDAGRAGIAARAREGEHAPALLRDCAGAADDARVGRVIGPVEDERAVVCQRRNAEHAGRAADADLKRAAGVQIDGAVGTLRKRAANGHEATRHGERAGSAEADCEIAAIGPRAATDRGRADTAGAGADRAGRVADIAAGHVQRAGAGNTNAETAAIGPRAARYRGGADAAGVVAEIAKCIGDAAAVHVERAGAVEADVEVAAIRPRAAAHRGRAVAANARAEIAGFVGHVSASDHCKRGGASCGEDEKSCVPFSLRPLSLPLPSAASVDA